MQEGARERVDTLQVGTTWVVRVGSTEVGAYASRSAALDAGWRLANATGRVHVVHYALSMKERLAAAAARRSAIG